MSAIDEKTWNHWLPTSGVRSWDWVRENCLQPNGANFDGQNFPWGKGVCDAWDDPNCRQIVLQWGSRLGKTFIAHCLLLSGWAGNPMPSMFGSSTEPLATDIVRQKLYPMIEQCIPLRDQLKSAARRSMHRIDLRHCHCRVAWSGSEAALADFGAYYLHANEIDKWSSDTSKEADPLQLFCERAKEFPDHKIILESTPGTRGKSRVEPLLESSRAHGFFVPCVHCGLYQVLDFGEETPGECGVIWDKGADGHSDIDRAYATARYACPRCKGEIFDDDRAPMIRAGVWVPAGCSVDRDGKLTGEPNRAGRIQGFQLSSLYSLQLRWGDVAAKWVASFRRPKERQNFINSWLGKTYEETVANITPEQLAERTKTDFRQCIVPDGTAFLTLGIDRQDDHRVFVVVGWSSEERGHVVDYGVCQDDDDLLANVVRRIYTNGLEDPETIRRFRAALVLYDSGFETKQTYKFCRDNSSHQQPILAVKGVEHCSGKPYRKVHLAEGDRLRNARRAALSARGQLLVHLPNDYWQSVVQQYVSRARRGAAASLTLCTEAAEDQDFLEQLLNQGRKEKRDKKGRLKTEWVVRHEDVPDDFRDALKMARCAAEMWLRGRWARVPLMLERAGRLPVREPDLTKPAPPRKIQAKREPFVRELKPENRRRPRRFVLRRRDRDQDS